jgi:hypothetical protein
VLFQVLGDAGKELTGREIPRSLPDSHLPESHSVENDLPELFVRMLDHERILRGRPLKTKMRRYLWAPGLKMNWARLA